MNKSHLSFLPECITKGRRLLLVLVLVCCSLQTAWSQQQRFSGTYNNVDVFHVLESVQSKTKFTYVYNADLLKGKKVTISAKNETLASFMSRLCKMIGLEVVWDGDCAIIRKKTTNAKKIVVMGHVTDEGTEPLPGVAITVMGKKGAAVTNSEGNYRIEVEEQDVLCFSFIGMKQKKILVDRSNINIVMQENVAALNDVVVTGYQTIDRSKLTSAVTTLKMEDINNPGMNNIDQMLEGKVPGMIFTTNSGQLGAAPKLRIRGTSTIVGNREPLWVLDGIVLSDPVNVDPQTINDPDFVNLLGNAISGLNPNDIEQIDVLKDASATALYGAKAGNGVIVITTKKGKIGKPSVSYNGSFTYTQRPRYADDDIYMMNAAERMDVSKELIDRGMYYNNVTQWSGYEEALLNYYKGAIDYQTFKEQADYYNSVNTDWLGLLMNDSFSHNHTVSLSGGSPNIKYYASLGYNQQNGVIKKEKNDRYSTMLNLSTNYRKFSAQFQLSANTTKRNYIPSGINVMDYAYNMSRTMPAYNTDGSLFYYPRVNTYGYKYDYNILNEINNSGDTTDGNAINLRAQMRYEILPCLNIDALLAYGIQNTTHEEYYTKDTYYVFNLRSDQSNRNDLCPVGGQLKREETRNTDYTARLQANFMKNIGTNGNHLITASAGIEAKSTEYKGFNITRRGYFTEFGGYFDQVSTDYSGYYAQFMASKDGLGYRNRLLTNELAWYATAGYGYKDTYLFNVHIRGERSNLFGTRANEEFSPIWALSGRWNMKKDVLKNTTWVDDASLRLSWGWQGNMLPGQTARMIIQQSTLTSYDFNQQYATIYKYPNPDLKWEKTASYNAGIDFALLNNKIRGTISYFYKHTTDAFLTKTVSEINGINQYVVNGGTLDNQGVEVSLSFTPINNATNVGGTSKRGFVWRIDPQIGEVINKVVNRAINNKTNTLHDVVTYNDYLNGSLEFAGKPIGTFYSYKFKGLNPADGSPMFYGTEEENKDELHAKYSNMTKQEVFEEVMEESGSREPYIQGSVNNYFGWRNFGLSVNFTYSLGNKIRLMKIASGYATNIIYPQQNLRKEYVQRWRRPGDEAYTNIPGLVIDQQYNTSWWQQYPASEYALGGNLYEMYDNSNIRVVSGNYLKLQSLSFRYNFDDNLVRKFGLQSMYISFTGNNLWTLCSKELKGQDPTQNGTTPSINLSTRPTYTLNINLTI